MTRAIAIPEGERGVVRLFAVDLPPEEARVFAADPGALARALGIAADPRALDPAHVDVFPVSRVDALGLPTFLAEAHGIEPADIAPQAQALAALDGHVAIVLSRAFGDAARTVVAGPPLRHVATWREAGTPVTFGALPEGGAAPGAPSPLAAPPPAPAGASRRTTRLLTLLLLAAAILGFLVLGGGQ